MRNIIHFDSKVRTVVFIFYRGSFQLYGNVRSSTGKRDAARGEPGDAVYRTFIKLDERDEVI